MTQRTTWIVALALAASFSGCANAKKVETPANPPVAEAPAATPATPVANASESPKVSCTRGKETRILEITKKESGCALDYEKSGKMKTISSSALGLTHCLKSEKKLKTKLEHVGFVCT